MSVSEKKLRNVLSLQALKLQTHTVVEEIPVSFFIQAASSATVISDQISTTDCVFFADRANVTG